MLKVFVFADFHWLPDIDFVGTLSYERLRGSDSYSFEFDKKWLQNKTSIQLSPDLINYSGLQYTQPGKEIFSAFSDALPDRWGRTLINKRELIVAKDEKRPVKRLTSFDYLTSIDDFSRMGGFRFKWDMNGGFINDFASLNIPPLTKLSELVQVSYEIEKCDKENTLPEKKWIAQLLQPGSSLGGARPKASVIDEKNNLYIAKFPSINDDHDVALWECLSSILAQKSGINTAFGKTLKLDTKYHFYLTKRFDRTTNNKRIHFASALTLLGLEDGDNATTGKGYIDIVDFILQNCTDVNSNLEELFRRVAFNICIGNSDDHFRNHGFILTPKGWTLSPAYDMNPTLNNHQSLLINANTNEANLDILLDSCNEYFIKSEKAIQIIQNVKDALKNWETIAQKLNIPKHEINYFKQKLG